MAMMLEPQVKQERFNARLSEEQKAILQRAADLQGMSLSDFVLSTAQDEALRVIESHEIIRLSQKDSAAFLQALESPSAASEDVMNRFAKARKHRA
jgi:uncharacterized protein (DUF1778 family)